MVADARVSVGAVFAAFRAKGMTARSWALAHGWRPASVYLVIREWIEHPDRCGRMPLGGVNRAIIKALHAELGAELVPLRGTDDYQMERAA